MSIPDQIKYEKATAITIQKGRTIVVKDRVLKVTEIDFSKNVWIDDPTAKTVTSKMKGWKPIVALGGESATPYDPNWTEDKARAALLQEVGAALSPPVPASS